jgi:hypothetical protein
MQAEILAQIIILDPLSIIIFGYLLYTLKRKTEFYGGPRNLNALAFAMKYPIPQYIKIVYFLSPVLWFTFFRGSDKLLNISVTLSGVRSWIIEKENKILTLNISWYEVTRNKYKLIIRMTLITIMLKSDGDKSQA